jgi:hypothetical protein
MSTDVIVCPSCQTEIEVTEVLSAQLRVQLRKELEAEVRRKEIELTGREQQIIRARQEIDREVAERLEKERAQLSDEALTKAREQVTIELKDKDRQLADLSAKLNGAEQEELKLRQERRELEEQKRNMELTLMRQIDEERSKIREAAKKEAAEERLLKDAEKDKLLADMRKQIEDLKRKAEQGSQQLQGEVLEVALEELIRRHFPFDEITPIAKGVHGSDVMHSVRDSSGAACGLILWESKHAKNWSDGWLPKLRDDQRSAKAQIAILVSVELPNDLTNFGHIDGIWVTSLACATSLASALRAGLIEVASAKRSLGGRHDKMEMLYAYLSDAEFRHRVEGIAEAFITLREELEAEKRSTQLRWAKREKQLDRALAQTSGMYGDLSGILGATLPVIEKLTPLTLPAPDADSETDT